MFAILLKSYQLKNVDIEYYIFDGSPFGKRVFWNLALLKENFISTSHFNNIMYTYVEFENVYIVIHNSQIC